MSTVELTREPDGPELVAALAAHGLKGELLDDDAHLVVQVEDCDDEQLAHAIEDWLRAGDLPLVPVRLDDCTYALAPPAA
jgi:hypothetical protein